MNFKKIINWKLYFVLLGAGILSVIAVMPYAFTLQADLIQSIPIPLPVLVLVSTLQSSIMIALALFFGLLLAGKLGLGLPFLEPYLSPERAKNDFKPTLYFSIIAGIIVGLAIVILDIIFTKAGVSLGSDVLTPVWQGFLASFYGGITEEILLRLLVMTLIIWIFSKLSKSEEVIKNSALVWIAIIISAILFGLGHLPATAAITALTPLVIIRALVLNGIGAVVFGWLYWKKGLESAMIAHFTADIIIHVIYVSLF
jgi:membrane protease YdiL (CAAX protease family)